MEIAHALRYETTRNLRSNSIVRECLVWAHGNQAALQERIDYVSKVSQQIGELLDRSIVPQYRGGRTYIYPSIRDLHTAIEFGTMEIPPHSLNEAYEAANQEDDLDYAEAVKRETGKTFKTLEHNLGTTNADTVKRLAATPQVLATYLLVQGISTFAQEYYNYPEATTEIYRDTLFRVAAEIFPSNESFNDFISILRAEESVGLAGTTRFLNKALKLGVPMYKLVPYMQEFPRPIAVDYNNVIVNNSEPEELNPEAPSFLRALEEIGNVFIVTSHQNREAVQSCLEKYNLWSDNIVLMAFENYRFLLDGRNPHTRKLRDNYDPTIGKNVCMLMKHFQATVERNLLHHSS